MQFVVRMM